MASNEFLKAKAQEDLSALIPEFEREIALPDGFSDRLVREDDDWSFIVKLHALLEAAVSHAVLRLLAQPGLEREILRLPFNGRAGRIAFLRSLDPMDKSFSRFVAELSRIRNLLVHDVHSVRFNLNAYVQTMDESQLERMRAAFMDRSADSTRNELKGAQLALLKASPRGAIFHMCRFWIARIYLGSQHELFRRFERLLSEEDIQQ